MEEKKEPKKLQIKLKLKTLIIMVVLVIILLVSNVFAGMMGYGNIFFAIKNLVTTETKEGKEEIFEDESITISYKPIEITDGVTIQINEAVLSKKGSKFNFYVTNLENKKVNLDLEYWDARSLGKKDVTETGDVVIETSQVIDKTKELVLVVTCENILKFIDIDLVKCEIIVSDESEFEKISESELKKYLNVLSLAVQTEIPEDHAIDIAYKLRKEVIGKKDGYDADVVYKTVKAMFDKDFVKLATTEKSGVTVFENLQGYEYDSKTKSYKSITDGADLRDGKCLKINDISYENGCYIVSYVVCYYGPNDEDIESLPRYDVALKLKYDKNSEYSKFKIVEIIKSEVQPMDGDTLEEFLETEKLSKAADAIKRYMELVNATELTGTLTNLNIKYNYDGTYDGEFAKTDVKYSEFKKAALNIMSKRLFSEFEKQYEKVFKETSDGYFASAQGGGAGWEFGIIEYGKKDTNKYEVKGYKIYEADEKKVKYNVTIVFDVENVDDKVVVDTIWQMDSNEVVPTPYVTPSPIVTEVPDEVVTPTPYVTPSLAPTVTPNPTVTPSPTVTPISTPNPTATPAVKSEERTINGNVYVKNNDANVLIKDTYFNRFFQEGKEYTVAYTMPNDEKRFCDVVCNENRKLDIPLEKGEGRYILDYVTFKGESTNLIFTTDTVITSALGKEKIPPEVTVELKNVKLDKAKSYDIAYFDPNGKYKVRSDIEIKEDGKAYAHFQGYPGKYTISMLTEKNSDEPVRYNLLKNAFDIYVDDFGNAMEF